jgi:hypothetical protein
MQEGARHLPQIFPFLLILLVFLVPGILAAAQSQQQRSTPYSYQPLSPRAIPTVAIIGTAKAGTTDLYTLLTSTSQLAPGGQKKRKYTWHLIKFIGWPVNSSSSSGGGGGGGIGSSTLLPVLFSHSCCWLQQLGELQLSISSWCVMCFGKYMRLQPSLPSYMALAAHTKHMGAVDKVQKGNGLHHVCSSSAAAASMPILDSGCAILIP